MMPRLSSVILLDEPASGGGCGAILSRECAETCARETPIAVPVILAGGAVGARVPPMLTTMLSSLERARFGAALSATALAVWRVKGEVLANGVDGFSRLGVWDSRR